MTTAMKQERRPAANRNGVRNPAGRLDVPTVPEIRVRVRLDLRNHDRHVDGDVGRYVDSKLHDVPVGAEVILHLRSGQHWSPFRHCGHVGRIVIECEDVSTAQSWYEAMTHYGIGRLT